MASFKGLPKQGAASMKKIGFITKNKVFAQSLATQINNNPALGFVLYLLHDPGQALLDAEVLKIDLAVVEMITGNRKDNEAVFSFCKSLRQAVPGCRLMLFVAQDDNKSRKVAIKAMQRKIVDDFVFYDESLQYLIAKLLAL